MSSDKTRDPIRIYRLVCGFITTMPIFYMGLAVALMKAEVILPDGMSYLDPRSALPVTLGVMVLGTTTSLASILVKVFLLRLVEARERTPGIRFRATIVAIAVAESGAVMGFVLMLITGSLLYGGLICGLSFAITCFHFPSRYWLEEGDSVL